MRWPPSVEHRGNRIFQKFSLGFASLLATVSVLETFKRYRTLIKGNHLFVKPKRRL